MSDLPADLGIPALDTKTLLASSPLKSRFLSRRSRFCRARCASCGCQASHGHVSLASFYEPSINNYIHGSCLFGDLSRFFCCGETRSRFVACSASWLVGWSESQSAEHSMTKIPLNFVTTGTAIMS